MLQENPDWYFLFGDNLDGKGMGGQAKECRGEPNAIGIPTKKHPAMGPKSFFTDDEFEYNKAILDYSFSRIPKGAVIVVPQLGVGLAQLPVRAPKTYEYLLRKLKELENET